VCVCVSDGNEPLPPSLWVLQEMLMAQMAQLVKHMVYICVYDSWLACIPSLDCQATLVLLTSLLAHEICRGEIYVISVFASTSCCVM
jgi:hypothetical protein